MSFDTLLYARDTQGSMVAVLADVDGQLKTSGSASVSLSASDGVGEADGTTLRIVTATDNVASVAIVSGSSSGTQYNDQATPDQSGGTGTLNMIFDGGSTQSWLGTSYGIGQVLLSDFDSSLYGISNPLPMRVAAVTDFVQSVKVASQDAGYEVKQVSGFTDSVNVVGFTTTVNVVGSVGSDVADDGEPPVKFGGIARQTIPTPVANGDRVTASFDDFGRQLFRPIQVRDQLNTAYATLNSNNETTLLADATGIFNDLVYISFANTSSGTITVDLREATGGGVVDSYAIGAGSTSGYTLPVPRPQSSLASTWTVKWNSDFTDISNTKVYVSALFTKEV